MSKSIDYDVVVIGGGPAGLYAALTSADQGKRVLVLEKMPEPGRKLLITGSGQCNVTHDAEPEEFLKKFNKPRFLKRAMFALTSGDVKSFFKKNGVPLKTTPKGKVFPVSEKAADILDVLLNICRKRKVEFKAGVEIEKIDKSSDYFIIKINGSGVVHCGSLIISTGGMSYPKTGSTGDGYRFAKSLGHTIIPPKPALADIRIENHSLKELTGVSFENIHMEIWRNNRKILTHRDDMLITHLGFSGPVVLNRSREILKGDRVVFDFTGLGEEFRNRFRSLVSGRGKQNLTTILKSFDIPNRMIRLLLELNGIKESLKASELNKKSIQKIIEIFSSSSFAVKATGGFNMAMVTTGGVETKEIKASTMESAVCKNLFFAGEVMDIDGETGGYNLQAAFSTGYLAGKNA